jgi:hypothetical protein
MTFQQLKGLVPLDHYHQSTVLITVQAPTVHDAAADPDPHGPCGTYIFMFFERNPDYGSGFVVSKLSSNFESNEKNIENGILKMFFVFIVSKTVTFVIGVPMKLLELEQNITDNLIRLLQVAVTS